MKNQLYMRDFMTFRVSDAEESKRFLHECKDSVSDTGYSLLVHVDATHAGIVNGNARFYRPDLMSNSVHTWGDNKRTQKPVLAHHDSDSDPLGRVATWKYIDLRHEHSGKHGSLNNLLFYDATSASKMDLWKSVHWVYENLQRKSKDYTGLGKIQLGLNVTHPETIGKIQRGEYATVSVGFKTDAALCSICHQDWAEDGKCEHRLGHLYDKQRCFIVSGKQDFEELSFVTFPADQAGVVVNQQVVERAKDNHSLRVFLLGKGFDEIGRLQLTDSTTDRRLSDLLESDIAVAEEEEDMALDVDQLRSEIQSTDLTKERALALRTELEAHKDQKDVKRLLTTLSTKLRKNNWDAVADEAPTKEDVEAKLVSLLDTLRALSPEARKAYLDRIETEAALYGLEVPAVDLASLEEAKPLELTDFSTEDQAYFAALKEDEHYAELAAELEAGSDAKLSGEKRKKLKESTFCGPGRSFPVPDCAHVTAARRLVGRASLSDDGKKKVLACVSRKASSLGCGKDATESATDKAIATIGDSARTFTDSEHGKHFVTKLDDLHAHFHKLPKDEKGLGMSLLYHSLGLLENTEHCAAMKARIAADPQSTDAIVPKQELDDLHDTVDSYQTERKSLQDSLGAARDTNKTLVGQLKHSLATTIVTYSVLAKEAGYVDLTADQITERISERAQRQLISLQDSLRDLEEKLSLKPSQTQATASEAQATVVAATEATAVREIADSATLQDDADQPQAQLGDVNRDAKINGKKPFVSLAELRSLRQRSSVDNYKRLKENASAVTQ